MGLREEIEDARGAVANYGGISDVMNFGPRTSLGERMLYVMDLTINPIRRVKELLEKALNELQQNGLPVRGLWLHQRPDQRVLLRPLPDVEHLYEVLVNVPLNRGLDEKQGDVVSLVVESWVPFLTIVSFTYGVRGMPSSDKFNYAGVGPKEWRIDADEATP